MDARRLEDFALSAFWQGKQEEQAGTTLPANFPELSALNEAGYTASEDLEGADATELGEYAGLSNRAAEAVLAAHAVL